jgi:hypothetical protein
VHDKEIICWIQQLIDVFCQLEMHQNDKEAKKALNDGD